MGVSGSGKTTVGKALADVIDAEFVDADDFHPVANIEKMRLGHALSDADREPWLKLLRGRIDEWLGEERPVVLACSALKETHRQKLGADRDGIRLIFLSGPRDVIAERMKCRHHFMPPALLDSQLEALEPPGDALTLDIRKPVDQLVGAIRARL